MSQKMSKMFNRTQQRLIFMLVIIITINQTQNIRICVLALVCFNIS